MPAAPRIWRSDAGFFGESIVFLPAMLKAGRGQRVEGRSWPNPGEDSVPPAPCRITLATTHDMRYTTGHIVVEDHPPMATLEPEAVTLSENPAKFATAFVPYGLDEFGDAAPLDFNEPVEVVQPAASAAAVTSVASSASNGTLLAASATRAHATIYNSDASALCIKYGATATTSDFSFRILGGETWSMPYRYTGIIDGIWEADGTGAAKITSLTA